MSKYDRVLMQVAQEWAKESHCKRLKVGAVLAIGGRSIMSGYNGMPQGCDNSCETPENTTKRNVVHAEMNAILFCARNGVATEGATLYVAHSTCQECAAAIYHAGIVRVVYAEEFRDMSGIMELRSYGVEVNQIEQEGL